jgi:hypothetical protein
MLTLSKTVGDVSTLLKNAGVPGSLHRLLKWKEGAMTAALAYSRLAHHRNYYLEHDEINAGVAHIFHGVTRMCEVSPDEWNRFMERANNMKPLV